MGLYATSFAYGAPEERDSTIDATLLTELQTLIEDQRALIGVVPGEGNVNGVWVFKGDVYGFRNKVGGATAGMYKTTSTGWSEVSLGQFLEFDGTTINGEPVPGNVGTPTTIKGATSNAEGDLMAISYSGLWETGAKGAMVLTNITGTFQDDEDLQMALLAFDTGSVEIVAGDTLTGATSGKTAVVTSVTVASGAWDSGTAAGYLSVKNVSTSPASFTNSEELHVGGVLRALVNGAAEPTEVKIAVADGIVQDQTLDPDGIYEFFNYNFLGDTSGESMWGVNAVGRGFGYDGTTFYKIYTGMDEDKPKHLAAHVNHLFYAYGNGSIQHSSIMYPNQWSVITGSAELGVGDEVSGFMVETGDSVTNTMSVFTRNNTFILYGSSSANWALKKFNSGTGAMERTIQKMEQTFFLDDRGLTSLYTVYNFGDFQNSVASDRIESYIQKKKDNTVTSLRVRAKNQYRLFFDDKTGLELTFLNRKNMGILPFTLKHQIVCACSGEDSNGFEMCFAGFSDGYIRKMDSGTSFDGDAVDSFIRTAYYHYDSPGVRKRFRELNLEINADTATTLTVFPDYDYGGTYNPKTSPVSSPYEITVSKDDWNEDDISNSATGLTVVASERLKINGIGMNMGLIIKNSSIYDKPITLQGAVVEYSPRGMRR
jgi:hypothetical protein